MSGKRRAPAVARNRDSLAAVLREVLPQSGLVLEVASGSGEHALYFAGMFPALDWQPSDADPDALASIEAWRAEAGLANLRPPIRIDAARADWPIDAAEAVLCVNMVHISPWDATLGLLAGAAKILSNGAPLILYGPYIREGVETAPSNIAFDADLKARNAEWGLRRLADVDQAAIASGLEPALLVEMPANNIVRTFRRVG